MRSTILFIIALFFIGANTQFLKSNNFAAFTELDNNHFGSMILSTVSVHMQTEAPAQEIMTLLSGVQKGLEDDQVADDKLNATNQAKCDSDLADANKRIQVNTDGLANQRKIKADKEALLNTAEKSLADTLQNLARNQKQTEDETALRAQQHSEFKTRMNDHKEAIAAIDAAIPLIEKLKTGATSFIQVKYHLNTIQSMLEKHRSSHPLYGPIIETLAQLSTNADQEMVTKILDLFARLRTALVESRKVDQATEAQQAAAWVIREKELVEEKQDLTQKKKNLQTSIASLKEAIQNASDKIEEHQKALDKANADLKKWTARCEAESKKYLADQAERTREVAIIVKVMKYLKEKWNQTEDYLKARVNKF